jgi:hypothetical protein
MKVAFRAVAVSVMLSLAWAGPLAPRAAAQQPAAPPPAQPAPPPQMSQAEGKPSLDGYDVGAVAFTAFGLPFKAGLCALGGAFGIIVFAMTFGARPDAAAGIVEEGCGGKSPWIVRGSDIRPRPTVSKAFEWEQHRFDWER